MIYDTIVNSRPRGDCGLLLQNIIFDKEACDFAFFSFRRATDVNFNCGHKYKRDYIIFSAFNSSESKKGFYFILVRESDPPRRAKEGRITAKTRRIYDNNCVNLSMSDSIISAVVSGYTITRVLAFTRDA